MAICSKTFTLNVAACSYEPTMDVEFRNETQYPIYMCRVQLLCPSNTFFDAHTDWTGHVFINPGEVINWYFPDDLIGSSPIPCGVPLTIAAQLEIGGGLEQSWASNACSMMTFFPSRYQKLTGRIVSRTDPECGGWSSLLGFRCTWSV